MFWTLLHYRMQAGFWPVAWVNSFGLLVDTFVSKILARFTAARVRVCISYVDASAATHSHGCGAALRLPPDRGFPQPKAADPYTQGSTNPSPSPAHHPQGWDSQWRESLHPPDPRLPPRLSSYVRLQVGTARLPVRSGLLLVLFIAAMRPHHRPTHMRSSPMHPPIPQPPQSHGFIVFARARLLLLKA
jgi:hypothetical protein